MTAGGQPLDSTHPRGTWLALLAIALAVALTQLGEMFHETLDPDEASFILMGADVARGHLPFVHAFDLKPPMIFLLLGGAIALFGKSLVAVRLVGDLFLFATAALLFLTGRRLAGTWPALGGALLYVAAASLDFGLPTYSELPATAFLMAATLLLIRTPVSPRAAGLAGLMVSLAVLTRTNLYPVALAGGMLLFAASLLKTAHVASRAWLWFGLAGLVPPLLLALAYAWAGELATLKLAMIDVPLAYSGQIGPLDVLASHGAQFYVWTTIAPAILAPLALLAGAGVIASLWNLARGTDPARRWALLVLLMLTPAVALGVLQSGAAYPHYWLQLLPFAGLFAVLALTQAGRFALPVTLAALALPLGSALAGRAPETLALARSPASYDDRHDIAAAARHIAASGAPNPRVWAWYKHLVLWYLDAPQLSRAGVHPDNLARGAIIDTLAAHGYVSDDEIGAIMRDPPDFVVTDSGRRGQDWLEEAGRPAGEWLTRHYRLDARFGEVLVYRRAG